MLQDLFLHLAPAQCEQCDQRPKLPCLCLQCGAFMCAGDPSCRHPSGQGLCKPHATACGQPLTPTRRCSHVVLDSDRSVEADMMHQRAWHESISKCDM